MSEQGVRLLEMVLAGVAGGTVGGLVVAYCAARARAAQLEELAHRMDSWGRRLTTGHEQIAQALEVEDGIDPHLLRAMEAMDRRGSNHGNGRSDADAYGEEYDTGQRRRAPEER